jgi:hypothetical protein
MNPLASHKSLLDLAISVGISKLFENLAKCKAEAIFASAREALRQLEDLLARPVCHYINN